MLDKNSLSCSEKESLLTVVQKSELSMFHCSYNYKLESDTKIEKKFGGTVGKSAFVVYFTLTPGLYFCQLFISPYHKELGYC